MKFQVKFPVWLAALRAARSLKGAQATWRAVVKTAAHLLCKEDASTPWRSWPRYTVAVLPHQPNAIPTVEISCRL